MKSLVIAKYQTKGSLQAMGIFYLAFILFNVLFTAIAMLEDRNINGSFMGFEMSTNIFIFVMGLNAFKSVFRFGLANGISRKSIFMGTMITMGLLSVFMTLITSIITPLSSKAINNTSIFYALYGERYGADAFTLVSILENIVWQLATVIFVYLIGYFITVLYYRLNTIMKVVVSVGVPVSLFYLIPILLMLFPELKVGEKLFNLVKLLSGSTTNNPWIAVLTLLCASIVVGIITYLMIRRSVVKEK